MAPPTTGSGEQPSTIGICGISACKVYPPVMLPLQAVSSYLTFSPLLPVFVLCGSGNQKQAAVIFCGTVCYPILQLDTRLFTGALLCAVRTFLLSAKNGNAITRLVASPKITHMQRNNGELCHLKKTT